MAKSLDGMTQAKWDAMTEKERHAARDLSGLTIGLLGLEGKRVEVSVAWGVQLRRFWVGRSTGWRPVHLEIKTRRSLGGEPAEKHYVTLRVVDEGPR